METNSKKNSSFIVIGVGVLFIGIILIQFFSRSDQTLHARTLEMQRSQKDSQFKHAADSPIPKEERDAFVKLDYFPTNEAYLVEATFTPDPQADTLHLMTTTGEDRKMIRAGTLSFTLQERPQQLAAYRYLDPAITTLFVPFKDLTSGRATYGGGRYLDLEIVADGPYQLDFNRAYNPYCVYNEGYVCPLPPLENKLMVEIAAGEKKEYVKRK